MGRYLAGCLISFLVLSAPVMARSTLELDDANGGSSELQPVLQCVPYARRLSGISIYGDAHTWWGQAEGRYARGARPREGAVMAVKPYGNSRLGHVAAVSKVIDNRTLLISHANWLEPGKIENNVRAVDVSPDNDWSEVRIWYGPSQSLGTGHWPLYGFIYKSTPGMLDKANVRVARSDPDPIGAIIAASMP